MADPVNNDPAKFTENVSKGILKCVSESGIKKKKDRKNKKSGRDLPWFDDECRKIKNELKKLSKKLKHSPESNDLREKLFVTKRKFNNLIKKNKVEYKQSIIGEMHLNKKTNPKRFWNLLNKISVTGNLGSQHSNISISSWVNHFQDLLSREVTQLKKTACNEIGPLDFEITLEEIEVASKILKAGKSPGLDTIHYK